VRNALQTKKLRAPQKLLPVALMCGHKEAQLELIADLVGVVRTSQAAALKRTGSRRCATCCREGNTDEVGDGADLESPYLIVATLLWRVLFNAAAGDLLLYTFLGAYAHADWVLENVISPSLVWYKLLK
jgi:hypothetical protein